VNNILQFVNTEWKQFDKLETPILFISVLVWYKGIIISTFQIRSVSWRTVNSFRLKQSLIIKLQLLLVNGTPAILLNRISRDQSNKVNQLPDRPKKGRRGVSRRRHGTSRLNPKRLLVVQYAYPSRVDYIPRSFTRVYVRSKGNITVPIPTRIRYTLSIQLDACELTNSRLYVNRGATRATRLVWVVKSNHLV
jgi:hypothetical protein